MADEMNMTLQYARYYLSRGFHPIPIEHKGKKPLVKWEKYQTQPPTDADLVSWFSGPERNVGLVLGRGRIAVDFDGEGAEDLLRQAGIELPEDAPRSKTGNGHHIFLSVQSEVGDRIGLVSAKDAAGKPCKPQVDIRGRGYVVAPPSIHASGAAYEWIQRPDTLPEAPQALLTLLAQRRPSAAAVGGQEKWVVEAMQGAGDGLRDNTCTRLAGYFLKKKMPDDIVRETLYVFADRCRPPMDHKDVDRVVTSVKKREDQRAVAEQEGGATEADAVLVEPFQILGYNQGSYFYLPRGSQQVVELRAKHHTKLDLLTLAPHSYWERVYPGQNGPRWELAANALIRKCERAGVYDTSRIRGRGAWWDGDRAVLHLGDVLVADGKSTPIMQVAPGRYIYEASAPMSTELAKPLTAAEANAVVKVCELVNWEKPISAKLLAGWITVAPICGALSWRPHVWLTGPAGSGKSWVIEKIIRSIVGHIALAVQSETTEAGLRQVLGHDARPVLFDEIEGEDERAQMRIQNILALARQASSETGAIIIKGSPLGVAKSYRIRSCFAFSSIGVGLQQHADATRVSVLSVEKRYDPEKFKRLESLVATTFTPEYIQAFNARAIQLVPVIRANARIFAAAGAEVIGSQRLGDQVGALLAGVFALHSDKEISLSAAADWLRQQDWSEQKNVQEASDEMLCLNKILEHTLRVPSTKGLLERSIGELVEIAGLKLNDVAVNDADAHACLLRLGIRVERDGQGDVFIISASHTGIGQILRDTPWARGWGRTLKRIKGAQGTEHPIRFAGVKQRGIALPLSLVAGGAAGQGALL